MLFYSLKWTGQIAAVNKAAVDNRSVNLTSQALRKESVVHKSVGRMLAERRQHAVNELSMDLCMTLQK